MSSNSLQTINAGDGVEKRGGGTLPLLVGMQINITTMKTVWRFLNKLEVELPDYQAIPLLGIHSLEIRMKKTHSPVFIVALFTIARMEAT